MNKKYIFIIILIIICQASSIIGFLYNGNKTNNQTTVYILTKNISKNTTITKDMITTKTIDKKELTSNEIITNSNDIIGKLSTKELKKDQIILTNYLTTNKITFNYIENNKKESDISKPILNYQNNLYYYTKKNQLLEITYHDLKYEINDIISLNVLSIEDILNEAKNVAKNNDNEIYSYDKFNLYKCNNNKIYITDINDNTNYCM